MLRLPLEAGLPNQEAIQQGHIGNVDTPDFFCSRLAFRKTA